MGGTKVQDNPDDDSPQQGLSRETAADQEDDTESQGRDENE